MTGNIYLRATDGASTDLAPLYRNQSGRIEFADALYSFEEDDCHLCDLIEHRLNAGEESGEIDGISWEVVRR